MKLAYFSPLNPIRSGISDYSEELLPWLARAAELDLFVDGYVPQNPRIQDQFRVEDAAQFPRRRSERAYDACLYQMGNHACHAYAYRALQRWPGVTVLHDYSLHHLVVALTAARGDENAYIRELGYCHGHAGIESARQAIRSNHAFEYERFPANRRVIDLSFGVIVHSQYARQLLEAAYPQLRVGMVPLIGGRTAPVEGSSRARERFGLGDGIVFGSFGQVTPAKRIDVALRAFREVVARQPDARYLIVGDEGSNRSFGPLIDALGLPGSVVCTGYLPLTELEDAISAIDVGINLRWPILGESSAGLIRLLGAGKPTIVTAAGPFLEFPSEFCPKVAVGDDEVDQLAASMLRLADDDEARQAMGGAARAYVQSEHSPERCARQYLEVITQILK